MCVLILLLIRSEIAHELVIELFWLSVHELAMKYFDCCFMFVMQEAMRFRESNPASKWHVSWHCLP